LFLNNIFINELQFEDSQIYDQYDAGKFIDIKYHDNKEKEKHLYIGIDLANSDLYIIKEDKFHDTLRGDNADYGNDDK
jgi:hypothetical protein